MIPTPATAVRFTALDSWRGLCALWVALYHFRAVSHYYSWTWVRNGDVAVDFFFVLSGFVIAHAYGQTLVGHAARWRFLIRRFGRLYPLHIATLAVVLSMEIARWAAAHALEQPVGRPAFTGDTNPWALIPNLLLIHGLGLFRDFTWNIPSWSISVEWAVCGLFVLISLWRRPLLAAGALALLGFAIQVWISLLPVQPPEGHTAFARGLYGFFLGVLIHRAFAARRAAGGEIPGWVEWLTPALLVAALMFKVWELPAVPPLFFGALVFIFAFESGPLSRLLKVRPLTWLGEVSYSVYLVHYVLVLAIFGAVAVTGAVLGVDPFTKIENNLLLNIGGPWAGDAAAVAFLALTAGVAGLTYRWIEDPGRRWFNGLSNRVAPRRALLAITRSEAVRRQ